MTPEIEQEIIANLERMEQPLQAAESFVASIKDLLNR